MHGRQIIRLMSNNKERQPSAYISGNYRLGVVLIHLGVEARNIFSCCEKEIHILLDRISSPR